MPPETPTTPYQLPPPQTLAGSAVARVLDRLDGVRREGRGWEALCPAHPDRNPSLSLAEGDDGRVLLACRSRRCAVEAVVAALGLQMSDLFADGAARTATRPVMAPDFTAFAERARAAYAARRRDPAVLALIDRFHGTPEALDACGGGILDGGGSVRLVFPEHGPEGRLCGAKIRPGRKVKEEDLPGGSHGLMGQIADLSARPLAPVLVTEGGHDLLAVLASGRFADYVVVGLPGAGFFAEGAGKEWTKVLAKREITLALDADDAGKAGTVAATEALRAAGATVRALDWDRILDGGTIAKDLAEIIALGLQHPAHLDRLLAAVREAPGSGLRFRTVEELRAMPGSRIEWLVHGLLGIGTVTVLAALMKAGKSTLVAALLRALELGEPFAGFQSVKSSAVYLSEESASAVLEKCDAFDVRGAVFLTREDFDPSLTFADYIKGAVAEAKRRGARVLVVDTFGRFSRLGADQEKDAGAVQAVIEHALAAAAGGLAVLIIAHFRKGDGEDGEAIRGSTALPAAADVLIEVRRIKEEPRGPYRVLSCLSRYRETPADDVILEFRGDHYVRAGTREDVRRDAAKARIMQAVEEATEPLAQKEAIQVAGLKSEAAVRALRELQSDGALVRTGEGKKGSPYRYSVPGATHSIPAVPIPLPAPGNGKAVDSLPLFPPEGEEGRKNHREEESDSSPVSGGSGKASGAPAPHAEDCDCLACTPRTGEEVRP